MLTQSRIKNGRYIKGEQRILIFGEVCGSTREPHDGQHYRTWCDVCAEEMDMRDACGTGNPRLCKPYSPHDARGSKNSKPNTLISIR
jgi:hypothetical protein